MAPRFFMNWGVITSYSIHYTKLYEKATKEGVKYLVKCSMGTIRKYRPKKLVVIGLLGFKDPSITGCLQGLIHVFKPPLDMENLNFIYDKKVYDGTIYTHGKMPVITSYSIHYTKLYDFVLDKIFKFLKQLIDIFWYGHGYNLPLIIIILAFPLFVITSYSIHYTKLYEPVPRPKDIESVGIKVMSPI